MRINYDYLNDNNFLKQLALFPVKEYYFKIILLDWKENPITEIQGKAINSSINIDGQSSMRRTANISMIIDSQTNKINNTNNLFSINKKMSLEIGFLNNTVKYNKYKMLWFPLGVFVITGISISHSSSGLVAALNLKDKMCLLNGQCGGVIPASIVLDNYETIDENGGYVITKPTIYQIIKQLVNHYGKESLDKIIISDLDTKVKQVMKWSNNAPIYFLYTNDGQYILSLDENKTLDGNNIGSEYYNIPGSPFEFGDDIGFIYTDFTYPGDLIGDAGTNVAALLEQIKNTLGNYEFFYDIQGNFIFRQIKNFLNTSQSFYNNEYLNEFYNHFSDPQNNVNINLPVPDYIDKQMASVYVNYLKIPIVEKSPFNIDNKMIISCNNTPQYQSIKNDFVIWGARKNADGKQYPIRYHLAIDKKPQIGNVYKNIFEYEDPDDQDHIKKWHKPLIFNSKDDFPQFGKAGIFYAIENQVYKWDSNIFDYKLLNEITLMDITTTDWRTELYLQGVETEPYGEESNYYYTELLNEWPKIYDVRNGCFKEQVINNPSLIDFYLDIIDSDSLSEISVQNIGRRTQVFNEGNKVNCIFEPWIPDIVFIKRGQPNTEKLREECFINGQQSYQLEEEIFDVLQPGGSLNSAYEVIKQSIQTYVNYNNNISIQTLPIYCLQPNTRITVSDPDSDVYGDYIINSMSFSIDSNSMLTINATQILEKI